MRKKFSHVTFLHVYHHTGKYICSSISSYSLLWMIILNCFFALQAWYSADMWLHGTVRPGTAQWLAYSIASCTVSCTDTTCTVRSMKMSKLRFGGRNTSHKSSSFNSCCWAYIFQLQFLSPIARTRNYFVSWWRSKIYSWCLCLAISIEGHTCRRKKRNDESSITFIQQI